MHFPTRSLSRVAAGLAIGLSLFTTAAHADTRFSDLERTVAKVEQQLGARVGLSVVNTDSGITWFHRKNERFLMNSTFKVPLCGAVLARVDKGELSLTDTLPVAQSDLVPHAPITERRVGGTMSLAELCRAAIDMSDNTAANLLIDYLGRPDEVTRFFESIGDSVSRLDAREPELNAFVPGDPENTTSPAAATQTLHALLIGDALSPESRDVLRGWMSDGGVTGDLLRDYVPAGWQVFDKSGAGSHTRNLVALVVPQDGTSWIVTIFVSDVDAPFKTRNDALRQIGKAVVSAIGQ
ncbi:class A beta-lactamase [Pseudohoeflea suaedae]|uniref:Beta-lactamase n=1 Tax=Pseudohoeflea suaedae TaxID=877384 RepID=A0A4R5PJF3_9HYPH|nr:class A beta-lactamase [Pseudohoeflea suaedae]TDH35797.1 class A beta-lactamase [Pseudohoeflea suaedae]